MLHEAPEAIVYRWHHARQLGDIPEGAQGSFAEVLVRATRYDDWTVTEELTNGIFHVGGTFIGGKFDQFRFVTCEGIAYLVSPEYKFMKRTPIIGDNNGLPNHWYSLSHPF